MLFLLQDQEQQLLGRNALHALMGLEATPIKAGGFKYLHRDTGLMFEIAPATPDSAGQPSHDCVFSSTGVLLYEHNTSCCLIMKPGLSACSAAVSHGRSNVLKGCKYQKI